MLGGLMDEEVSPKDQEGVHWNPVAQGPQNERKEIKKGYVSQPPCVWCSLALFVSLHFAQIRSLDLTWNAA